MSYYNERDSKERFVSQHDRHEFQGAILVRNGCKAMIAQIGYGLFMLIGIPSGNRVD